MPRWGNTPLICLRCTQRLLPAGRPVLPGHSASSIRIATPRIQARHYETEEPADLPPIQQNLNRPARPLPLSPPADLLTPDTIAAEDQARAAEAAAAAQLKRKHKKQGIKVRYPSGSNHIIPLAQIHPVFPRPQEPHKYATTLAPTDAQLERARAFFARGEARFVFTCESFRKFPASPLPEVAFLGRSNVGKSSLLNALFGRRSRGSPDNSDRGTAKVSNRAGKTRTMNVFVVGEGAEGGVKAPQTDMHGKPIKGADRERWLGPGRAVAVVDMPGHGFGSKTEWGEEILKYLTKRTQLRRVFVLVDSEHGVKSSDRQLLDLLAQNGVSHQIVLSKVDKFLLSKLTTNTPGKVQQGLMRLKRMQEAVYKELQLRERERKGTPALGEILAVSAKKAMGISEAPVNFDKVGINGLRWAILQAAGLEQPWE